MGFWAVVGNATGNCILVVELKQYLSAFGLEECLCYYTDKSLPFSNPKWMSQQHQQRATAAESKCSENMCKHKPGCRNICREPIWFYLSKTHLTSHATVSHYLFPLLLQHLSKQIQPSQLTCSLTHTNTHADTSNWQLTLGQQIKPLLSLLYAWPIFPIPPQPRSKHSLAVNCMKNWIIHPSFASSPLSMQ